MSKNASNMVNQAQNCTEPDGYTQNRFSAGPLVLAVETSGHQGSVAIAAGSQLLAEAPFSAPMKHSAEIFVTINSLVNQIGKKPKEIEHIYISIGPGSFTGLRIAVTLAKTMHLANSVRIVAVDTLDVIAANANEYIQKKNVAIEKIATILDAKRGQFFIAVYEYNISQKPPGTGSGIWKKTLDDTVMTASEFLEQFSSSKKPLWLLGEGLLYYKDKFRADGISLLDHKYWNPRALNVHKLGWEKAQVGEFADPMSLQPKYLRHPDVKKVKKMAKTNK